MIWCRYLQLFLSLCISPNLLLLVSSNHVFLHFCHLSRVFLVLPLLSVKIWTTNAVFVLQLAYKIALNSCHNFSIWNSFQLIYSISICVHYHFSVSNKKPALSEYCSCCDRLLAARSEQPPINWLFVDFFCFFFLISFCFQFPVIRLRKWPETVVTNPLLIHKYLLWIRVHCWVHTSLSQRHAQVVPTLHVCWWSMAWIP